MNPEVKHDAELISQQITLLICQKEIDDADKKLMHASKTKFADFEPLPPTSLTINETIYYLTLYHYYTENSKHHPLNFVKTIDFNDKSSEYQFCVLHGLARLEDWKNIENELNKTFLDSYLNAAAEDNGKNDKNNKSKSKSSNFFGNLKQLATDKARNILKTQRSNLQISPMLASMLFRNNKNLREEFLRQIQDVNQRYYWTAGDMGPNF